MYMYSSNSLRKTMLPRRIASAVFVIFMIAASFAGIISALSSESVWADAYDKDTRRFDVDMTVNEDNTIDVRETIVVDFKEYRHGIYRYIPLASNIQMKKDGKVYDVPARIRIKGMDVEGYNYDTYTDNDNYVVQIGDADQYVYGKQRYEISYQVVIYEDEIKDFDYFYYNVIPMDSGNGSGWDTAIDSSTISITMPKKFDKDALEVYAGGYGVTKEDSEAAGFVKTALNGRTINIETQKQLPLGYGITVQEFLPEGYFVGAANGNGMSILGIIVSAAAAVGSLILFLIFGRDPKVVETVEFYPPEGMTSAEAGYIIDGYADDQDLTSLIIYYADKGYLTIEETGEGKKKSFTLHKLKDLPADAHLYETLFFNGLFMGGSKKASISQLKANAFYEDIKAAREQLTAMYTDKKEKRIFTKAGGGARLLAGLLMTAPGVCLGLISAWFCMDRAVLYASLFGLALLVVGCIGCLSAYDRTHSLKKSKRRGKTVIWTIIMLIGLAWSVLIPLLFIDMNMAPAAAAAAVCTIIAFICVRQMRKRTRYGAELMGKLLGFRTFLEKAEIPKLEALMDEDPQYFFNVLPFAHVFGLSDKWAKKFKDLAVEPPMWYRGYYGGSMFNTILFMSMFNSFNTSFAQTIHVPQSSGSGGGLGGGSFGGGGGFGGGGFGGGGGGSW